MTELELTCSKQDRAVIVSIVSRAEAIGILRAPRIDLEMDLVACHHHGCRLDLGKLLTAPDFDFAHDVLGIGEHLNRETGELEDFFLPRCAAPDGK